MDMLKSKTIDRICCLALVVMLVLTCAVWAGKASAGLKQTVTVGYEGLFDQSVVHTIDIEMEDWDSFIASATQEAYTECSITIDGEKITNVGIRGKGNTSLSSVATMGSLKYSSRSNLISLNNNICIVQIRHMHLMKNWLAIHPNVMY